MKNKNIFQSFQKAFEGFNYIILHHKHFKSEIFLGLIAIFYFLILEISYLEWLFVFLAIFFVLFSEIINTIIEETNNLITSEYHERVKIIKDISGSLVLISVIFSLIVFILITLHSIS
jgi:diacylglycerol kinase (ATP)